ncbi:MAG: site-specific integrase, partial [Tumebacillaceae bacterium]
MEDSIIWPAMIDHQVDLYMQYLQVEKRVSPHTLDHYFSDLEQFIGYMIGEGISSFAEINHVAVRTFVGRMARDRAKKTIARKISSLRSFYEFLRREGFVEHNPAKQINLPKLERRLPNFLYLDALEAFLAAPDCSTTLGLRDKALLEVLYASGIRVSECVGLNLPDIDFAQGTAIVMGKGAKERLVLFGGQAITALRNYLSDARPLLWQKG